MKKITTTTLTLCMTLLFVAMSPTYAQGMKEESERQNTQNRATEMVEKRTELKVNLEEKREEARTEFETKRETYRTRLNEIKDEKRQQIVERTDTRLTEINTRRTDLLLQHLERIAGVLDRIQEKADLMDGDTETIDEAVVVATDAIFAAEEAIAEQAGKEYIIEIEDDATLGTAVSTVVAQFKEDMQSVIELVREAKNATMEAARSLATADDETAMPADASDSAVVDEQL